jgi:hypothetical protein
MPDDLHACWCRPLQDKTPRQRCFSRSAWASHDLSLALDFSQLLTSLLLPSRAEGRCDSVAGGFQVTCTDPDVVLERGGAAVGVPGAIRLNV